MKMSQITFDKIYNSNNSNISDKLIPEEMFILFLQKIEESEGFGNFTKINNISHNYKTSNIIPPNFRIKFETKKEKEENKEMQIDLDMNSEEKIDINKNIEIYEPKYINYINEVYGKDLLNLYKTIFFIKMCLLMKNNEKYLSNKKYNTNNTNKIINKNNYLTTVNVSYGEIDYPTFIIAIEILSRYLFNNLSSKQAIDKLIVEYILTNKELNKKNKINEIDAKIESLKELQNNEEIISFLQIMHKAFYPLFSFYTKDTEGLMSLNIFMKFTKDFEIFPYLIGKAKLNSLFNAISQYSSFIKKNESFIEHSLFIDLIALMALEMIYPEPEPSPLEKMLIFIEKISESGGQGKIAMRTGNNRIGNCANFIDIFRKIYPGFFADNNNEENIEENFENLMKFENDANNEIINERDNNINENNNEKIENVDELKNVQIES